MVLSIFSQIWKKSIMFAPEMYVSCYIFQNIIRTELILIREKIADVILTVVIIMARTCFRVLLARKRCDIWSLNYSNGIRNHNHLVRKRKLNHLAKHYLGKCLSVRLKWLSIQIPLLSGNNITRHWSCIKNRLS